VDGFVEAAGLRAVLFVCLRPVLVPLLEQLIELVVEESVVEVKLDGAVRPCRTLLALVGTNVLLQVLAELQHPPCVFLDVLVEVHVDQLLLLLVFLFDLFYHAQHLEVAVDDGLAGLLRRTELNALQQIDHLPQLLFR